MNKRKNNQFKLKNAYSDLVQIDSIVYLFVYSWYAPRIDEEASQGFPLDPSAERIFEMRSVGVAIKKQRADIPKGRSALWVASSPNERI